MFLTLLLHKELFLVFDALILFLCCLLFGKGSGPSTPF